MPDFSGSFRVSESWLTPGSPDEVVARLASSVAATPPPKGQALEVDLGSRFAMRSLGFLIPSRKVPIRLTVEAIPKDNGTQLLVQAFSNQGWYAMSASRLTSSLYDRAFRDLLETLREAAPPA